MNQPQNPNLDMHRQLKRDIHAGETKAHLEHIRNEFQEGFEFIKRYPKSVTVFGSSMIKPEDTIYKTSAELTGRIAKETSYAILTGGGPGLMEAANKGAFEAGGTSIGCNVSLPHDHKENRYMTDSMKFSYFFARKAIMTFTAEAYIFLPGGFGTFDELFSVLTLIQTGKIPHVPVVLFGSAYWNDVLSLMRKTMLQKFHTVREAELHLFTITDSIEETIAIIKKAPVSDWWRNLN